MFFEYVLIYDTFSISLVKTFKHFFATYIESLYLWLVSKKQNKKIQ